MELLTLGLLVVLMLAVLALFLKKNTTGNPADTARLEAELAAATSTGTLLREQ